MPRQLVRVGIQAEPTPAFKLIYMSIKIRYTCVKELTTFSRIFTIEDIERGDAAMWMDRNITSSGVVHRDLFIGRQDEYGNDIYSNDIVSYLWKSGLGSGSRFQGVINQQGAEWFVGDDRFVNDGDEQVIEVHGHKVVGNIYTHPELIEKAKPNTL